MKLRAFKKVMNLRNGFLPDEVLLLVLARLPLKSVFRAKSVCKLWYSLLSDNYFIQLYNELAAKKPMVLFDISDSSLPKSSLICVDDSLGVSELSLDFLNDKVRVIASCNGLLCCSSIGRSDTYYVCNPLTREFRLLPHFGKFYSVGDAPFVGLARNLSMRKFNVVLARYHRSFYCKTDGKFTCLVFDSNSNKWRKFVSAQNDYFTHMPRSQVVYLSGSLHWLAADCSRILALDLESVIWRKISLPEEISDGVGNRVSLSESDGRLSVIQISFSWMNIWVLKDYQNKQWQVVDRVSLSRLNESVCGTCGIYPIIHAGECVFMVTNKQVLVHRRGTRVWKKLYSAKNYLTLPFWFLAHTFRSSINSCNKGLLCI